jgi:hypothetical protein
MVGSLWLRWRFSAWILAGKGGRAGQGARGAAVLGEVTGFGEVMGASHRHHVNRNHLRHQHGLDGIPRPDALERLTSSGWGSRAQCI